MTAKQIIRIHTVAGVEEIDADRLLIKDGEYAILNGDDEVRRIPCADIVPDSDSSGIETVYSRS